MLSRISFMDLFGSAGLIGLVGAGISLILVNKSRDRIRKQSYYINAFQVLDRNSAAIDLIGKPVRHYRIDLSDYQNNCLEPLSTRLKVPIKGTKRRGNLFVWADRPNIENEWILRRLEIIFDDIRDKKVVVFKNETKDETKD